MKKNHFLLSRTPLRRLSLPLAVLLSVALTTVYWQAQDPDRRPSSPTEVHGGGTASPAWEEGGGGASRLSPKEAYKQAWDVLDKNREPEPPKEGTTLADYTFVSPQNVCAFVSDQRPVHTPDEMNLSDPSQTRDALASFKAEGLSMAYWSNLSWALRHGYRFTKRIPESYPDRSQLWNKLSGMRQVASDLTCQYLVFMDSDLYIRQASYTINDMRLRWGMHDRALMMIAKDIRMTDGGWNTGFVLMRNGPELRKVLDDWASCPEKIAGCEKYKMTHKTGDQGAFIAHIMPQLVADGTLVTAPCNEANGNTGMSHDPANPTHCSGTIVTHNWWKAEPGLALETLQMLAYQNALLLEAIQYL